MRTTRVQFAQWCLALVPLLTLPALVVAQPVSPGDGLAADLMRYLGLTDHGTLLEQGDVVHSGLLTEEQLPEEVDAVGAMLLIRGVHPDLVIDAFMHSETFRQVHDIGRYGALTDPEERSDNFGELTLGSGLDLNRLARQPMRYYNVSRQEADMLMGTDTTGPQNTIAVTTTWRSILLGRLESFLEGGIPQIPSYVRQKGIEVSPTAELNSALRGSAFLEDEFPTFLGALMEPSEAVEAGIAQEYFWLETDFDGERVWALSAQSRLLLDDSAVAADVQFYASRGYNAMVTFIGVVPYGTHSLAFAINHTYTDEVLGFASGLKKRIARSRMTKSLTAHLEEVRRRLE